MPEPWYQDGLRFECQRCGACCVGDPGVVWVNREEIRAMAEALNITQATFVRRYTRKILDRRSLKERSNGDCVLYSRQRGCKVYSVRPRQCGSWPFWPSNLGTPDAWHQTCQSCPGAGRGRLYDLDEITTTSRVIKI